MSYDSLDELQGALKNHNDRALNGQPGAAQDQVARDDIDYSVPGMVHPDTAKQRPAEHVKRVILYGEQHPADFQPAPLSADVMQELFDGLKDEDGNVDPHALIQAVRNESSPLYPVDQGAHRSMYKAPGDEMDLSFLSADNTESESEGDSDV
jgi:hypothetical protein